MEETDILAALGSLPPELLKSLMKMSTGAVADPKVFESLLPKLLQMLQCKRRRLVFNRTLSTQSREFPSFSVS